jgi:hypothetical protein
MERNNMWSLIAIVITIFIIYRIDNRLQKLESNFKGKFSCNIQINAKNAVTSSAFFKDKCGIKSFAKESDISKFTKDEQNEWYRLQTELSSRTKLNLTYLSTENCFFVKTSNSTYISQLDFNKSTIYFETVFGDEDHQKPYIDFILEERSMELLGKHTRVLTGYLIEKENWMDKKAPTILFNFPYNEKLTTEQFNSLGFELEVENGEVYKDSLGDFVQVGNSVKLTQNDVSISL